MVRTMIFFSFFFFVYPFFFPGKEKCFDRLKRRHVSLEKVRLLFVCHYLWLNQGGQGGQGGHQSHRRNTTKMVQTFTF